MMLFIGVDIPEKIVILFFARNFLQCMKNSEQILETVQALMGAMRDGDMRGVVANLQAAMGYQVKQSLSLK